VAKDCHPGRKPGSSRTGYAVVIAVAAFLFLGTLPVILSALHLSPNTAPPTSSDGVRLLPAPRALKPVPLSPVARPVNPGGPVATLPRVSEAQEAAAVSVQDNWLRAMLHASFRFDTPRIVSYAGTLGTLVLTSGAHYTYGGGAPVYEAGQTTYTAADLIRYGALKPLPDGGTLLDDNVFVAAGARLDLSSASEPAIYLDDTQGGSASIVGWGGGLEFSGTRQHPLTIEGWDSATKRPATDTGNGRPYIREVAGRMTLTNVRVSSLGFWSGRTGGVAWTGLTNHPSTGGATSATFTGDTYGAFVTRGYDVRFSADLFESNQVDGLHIHRSTVGASATWSSAVRNGQDGFHVDRATRRTILLDDVAQHNGTNGFLVDGRPLVSSASASGNAVAPGSGTHIENSTALGNGGTGILVEGGTRTVLKTDEVCARQTGIALRYGASGTIVNGNDIRCGPRVGLSVGPVAPATLLSGNAISGARIGVLMNSPGRVELDNSLVTGATVFGISVRGANSVVFGKDNVISGTGYRAVDARADASPPALSGGNTAEWAYHDKITIFSYLEFHPLAILWLSIVFLVIAAGLWTRRRRAPKHPYPASTRWTDVQRPAKHARVLVGASAGTPPSAGRPRSLYHDREAGLAEPWPHDARPHAQNADLRRPLPRHRLSEPIDTTRPLARMDNEQ
jgi:hypothetical protein